MVVQGYGGRGIMGTVGYRVWVLFDNTWRPLSRLFDTNAEAHDWATDGLPPGAEDCYRVEAEDAD